MILYSSYSLNCVVMRKISFQITKHFMMTLRKLFPAVPLISKIQHKTFCRYPSFVAEGTLLVKEDYQSIRKLLYLHNEYLFNLDFSKNIDNQSLLFYKKGLFLNPKFFQHILSTAYPRANYSILELEKVFPGNKIDTGTADLFVTEDVVVAAAGAVAMKKSVLFSAGSLTVLACNPPVKGKKEKINQMALYQTNQKHPDYCYVYTSTDKHTGMWQRFYDLKTGKFAIDSGHIFCMSNYSEYEKKVAHHLHGQYILYKDIDKTIKNVYEKLLYNRNITWSERNIQIQEFFRDNLYKYPTINPSFILYQPLLAEIDKPYIPKRFTGFIIQDSLETIENTQRMIENAIIQGGRTCQENYMKHPDNCPIIVSMIKKYLSEKSQL